MVWPFKLVAESASSACSIRIEVSIWESYLLEIQFFDGKKTFGTKNGQAGGIRVRLVSSIVQFCRRVISMYGLSGPLNPWLGLSLGPCFGPSVLHSNKAAQASQGCVTRQLPCTLNSGGRLADRSIRGTALVIFDLR